MKKPVLAFVATAILATKICSTNIYAQKKPLDHDVYDSWETVEKLRLSPDGSIICWEENPQAGDGRLQIRNLTTGQSLTVERGSSANIPQDAEYIVLTVKAPYADTRQAKIDKKKADEMPQDTLAYVTLKTFELTKIGPVKSFKVGYDHSPYIFASIRPAGRKDGSDRKVGPNREGGSDRKVGPDQIGGSDQISGPNQIGGPDQISGPDQIGGPDRKEGSDRKGGSDLIIVSLSAGTIDTLKMVEDFAVSKDGGSLAVVIGKDKKDSLSESSVKLIDIAAKDTILLSGGRKEYTQPSFSDGGDLLFMATDQELKTDGTQNCSLFISQRSLVKKGSRSTPAVYTVSTEEIIPTNIPEGWVLGKNARPRFSNSGNRIVLNITRHIPAKDTTLVEFETPKLDIWRWDAATVPPMDKVSRNAAEMRAAVVNLSDRKLIVLGENPHDMINYVNGADSDFAISKDSDKYFLDNYWAEAAASDYSVVSLTDGTRRSLAEGLEGDSAVSPYGKYILLFSHDDGQWYSINTATGAKVCLTEGLGVNFFDEEDDHPMKFTPVMRRPDFVGEDEAVLLCDRYDVWRIALDGSKAENMTRGQGRSTNVKFRAIDLEPVTNNYLYKEMRTFPKKGRIYLSAFSVDDSRNGYAYIDAAKPSDPKVFLEEKSFLVPTKAASSSRIAFLKGDFRHPMDVYTATDIDSAHEQLSHINPRQADYRWGNVQLVHWDAYDGTPMKGLLYTPDDLDEGGKYPMMVYFYEKYSENLYRYFSPAPSRSIINISFYVSRGYVVFVPDIVYVDGHPGESAYNCIVSGTEAMCEQFGFIDKSKMALQGQSWGGYQTAYLVTRTNLYAAAGAGAPVSNMTSAYGGIRWESGSSRISQYERGQSRIGKTLWEPGGLELYIENSPVFSAPNVQTPLLIMHNDADGAVPWYQGIEYFMALRRLGKPVWLLEYNDESHNLTERRNSKDLSIRLQQFFDYYLKGAPEPAWMKTGIPHSLKGSYFGYENADAATTSTLQ